MSSNTTTRVTAGPASPLAPHLPTTAESPKRNHDDLKSPDLGAPTQTLEGVSDAISASKDQDACNPGIDFPNPIDVVHNWEPSLLMEDCTTEEDQQTLHGEETETAAIAASLALSTGSIEKEVAAVLSLANSEECELDGDFIPEEKEGSEYEENCSPSSDDDCERTEQQANSAPNAKKHEKKAPRKLALNAREYVARLHEAEDRKDALRKQQEEGKNPGVNRPHKRKPTGVDSGSRKALKTANGSFLSMFNSGSSASDGNPLLPAEPIEAKTHAEQIAKMMAGVPEGYDTRRRKTQKQDLQEAIKLFGYKRVEAINGDWKLKGMTTPMRNHQITAVAWMMKRELARMEPFGGILADGMGIGKTIMSLACIVGNQADTQHLKEFCNATLVVVPNKTIALQWEGEAMRHCAGPVGDKVFIYDKQREDLMERCKRAYIVIATYNELVSQYPKMAEIKKLRAKYGSDDISFGGEMSKLVGNLFRIDWYRIILDEAHAIRNYESATAQACFGLLGKYRWALSGTPLANSSNEMFSYMKFVNCKWTSTPKEFRSKFFEGDQPNDEFEEVTSLIMYRRIMEDAFLGHPIINLPERIVVNLWVPLSIEEQVVVDAVSEFYKKRTALLQMGELQQNELNEEIEHVVKEDERLRKKKDDKKYTAKRSIRAAMWMLGRASQVRKRQAISHVFCIERLLRHSFSTEELADLSSSLMGLKSKRTILEQIQVIAKRDRGIALYQVGLQILQEQEENFFGKYFDMEPLLDILGEESMVRDATCPLCGKESSLVDPRFSHLCKHIYCIECIYGALIDKTAGRTRTRKCSYEDCHEHLGIGREVKTMQKIIDKARAKESTYREPGRDCLNASIHQEDDRNGFFISSTFCDGISILPSTKLTATMAVVLTWLDEAPNDKILIFTQFTGSAKMLGLMLQTMGIGFVYYYGGLAPPQKTRALDAIKSNDEIKVMVSTLKSGGQSLNLTVANRVIIIDPWWNKTAEQQAFGRVVRIGQEKITHLVNIKTKELIDYRIYTLQEVKAKDVDRTLQDDRHTTDSVN